MLLPLAPTLKMLGLGGNKLGGTITDDIASFAKLEYLWLSGMGLKGTFAQHPFNVASSEMRLRAQDPSRSSFCAGSSSRAARFS